MPFFRTNKQMARYFTPQQVNDILPEINELMADLLARRAKVVRQSQLKSIQDVVQDNDTGNATASHLIHEFEMIEKRIDQIRAYGCEIKDLNGGLLDFLARRRGRDVYLCWRYGESLEVAWYHELHAGFHGRQIVDGEDFERR